MTSLKEIDDSLGNAGELIRVLQNDVNTPCIVDRLDDVIGEINAARLEIRALSGY